MTGNTLVPLVLAITAYAPGSAFDSYDDGTTVMFDVATVRIVEGDHEGETLDILVEPESPEAALWNRPGDELRAAIDAQTLAGDDTIFAAAFRVEKTP